MKSKIGIIGGAGPMASCKLYEKVIKICQRKYKCKNDKDFPEIHIISYPFSDMITVSDRKINQQKLFTELQECFNQFLKNDIDIIAIACNTLHTIIPESIKTTSNFIHISDVTLEYAKYQACKKLLVLGSQTTLEFKLYSSPLIECITPNLDDQVIINNVIENILIDNITLTDAELLKNIIISYLLEQGVDGVILGCTELPLLHEIYSLEVDNLGNKIKVFDTLEILADQLVKRSLK
jgi:aspartate racemase